MSDESRLIGFTALHARACFHARGVKSRSGRSPVQIAQAHSLVLGLLFRVPSLTLSRPRPFGRGLTARVSSLSATSPETRPLISRVPKSSIRSVRRCSQPLDGFLRAPAPGLVSSQSRLQGSPLVQGLPISAQRSYLFGPICPLAVVTACRSPGRILTATAGVLGFEALFRAGARAPRGR